MSIYDEISLLSMNKSDIYNAIVAKGVTPTKNGYNYFASAIANINASSTNVININQLSQIDLLNVPKGTCYVYNFQNTLRYVIYLTNNETPNASYYGNPEWYVFEYDSGHQSFNMLGFIIAGQDARHIGPNWMKFYTFNENIDFSKVSASDTLPNQLPVICSSNDLSDIHDILININMLQYVYYNNDLGSDSSFLVYDSGWINDAYRGLNFIGDSTIDSYQMLWLLCNGKFSGTPSVNVTNYSSLVNALNTDSTTSIEFNGRTIFSVNDEYYVEHNGMAIKVGALDNTTEISDSKYSSFTFDSIMPISGDDRTFALNFWASTGVVCATMRFQDGTISYSRNSETNPLTIIAYANGTWNDNSEQAVYVSKINFKSLISSSPIPPTNISNIDYIWMLCVGTFS